MKDLTALLLCVWLCAGYVLAVAHGFWSFLAAIFFPPYAAFLVIEALMRHFGML